MTLCPLCEKEIDDGYCPDCLGDLGGRLTDFAEYAHDIYWSVRSGGHTDLLNNLIGAANIIIKDAIEIRDKFKEVEMDERI